MRTIFVDDRMIDLLDAVLHRGMTSGVDDVEKACKILHKEFFEPKDGLTAQQRMESMEIRSLFSQHYKGK